MYKVPSWFQATYPPVKIIQDDSRGVPLTLDSVEGQASSEVSTAVLDQVWDTERY